MNVSIAVDGRNLAPRCPAPGLLQVFLHMPYDLGIHSMLSQGSVAPFRFEHRGRVEEYMISGYLNDPPVNHEHFHITKSQLLGEFSS